MTHSMTATINLAGPQRIKFDAHGENSQQGNLLLITIAGVMITLYDRRAVEKYCGAIVDDPATAPRLLSPHNRELARQVGTTMSVAVTARHTDECFLAAATFEHLRLRTGPITWVIHDRAAYDDIAAAWTTIRQAAPALLPARA